MTGEDTAKEEYPYELGRVANTFVLLPLLLLHSCVCFCFVCVDISLCVYVHAWVMM